MRKSAIPLVFFVVMCSLNILLAGCGAYLPKQNTTNVRQTNVNVARSADPISSECATCDSHSFSASTSLAAAFAGFQSQSEDFPPSLSLVDTKISQALVNQNLDPTIYSRIGKVLTFNYQDGKKLIVTLDDNARVKEVKQLGANSEVIQRFSQTYGSYSAPLTVNNLMPGSPAILATANYNESQQLFSITDNVNAQTLAVTPPVSPYPPLLYTVPPPAEMQSTQDGLQQGAPSAAVQACWNGCRDAYDQAKADAYSTLALATASALAVYLAGLLVCLASAAFYPICAAGFYMAYAATLAIATAAWLAALAAAAEDLKACLNACCVANGLPPDSWKRHVMLPAIIVDPWNNTSSDDLN